MKKKVWMGVGVSNSYINIIESLKDLNIHFDKFIIIIADEINEEYNPRNKGQLHIDLFNLAKKIPLKFINVKFWNYLSSRKIYKNILEKYKDLFINNKDFRKEVLLLVKKNRHKGYVNGSEGYVLEELASISYMADKGYTKIGIRSKEESFDKLAKKYPLSKNISFEYF